MSKQRKCPPGITCDPDLERNIDDADRNTLEKYARRFNVPLDDDVDYFDLADQIKSQGKSMQEQMHLQGFGTASVKKYLDVVKDKLPAIAKEAHVDFIVSKWDVVYQDPAVEAVDVTEDIVKAFEPNAQTLKSIQDLIKHPPIAEEEIRKIKD